MKKRILSLTALLLIIFPSTALAFSGDLILDASSIRFSDDLLLEGKKVRIYGVVKSNSSEDLYGTVRFTINGKTIQGDQPVSVLAGQEDAVFVDWIPTGAGKYSVNVNINPFEDNNDNPANNSITISPVVYADTDRDGIPNYADNDDDNDGTPDEQDAFPLNPKEWKDSDGDGIGDNEDLDDDNDGVPDTEDAFPLDATESKDSDGDGIGDNADLDDDNDGVPDALEALNGTDSKSKDSDGDGVEDKDDLWPTDPLQTRDYDKDGISDEKDEDADGDGKNKSDDHNDLNAPPKLKLKTLNSFIDKFALTNSLVKLTGEDSFDPDGKINFFNWSNNGVPFGQASIATLDTSFDSPGKKTITLVATDDKGETSEITKTLYIVSSTFLWFISFLFAAILVLAIHLIISYSKRRNEN